MTPGGASWWQTSFNIFLVFKAKEEWWAMLIVGKRKLLRPSIRAYLIGHYKTQTPSLIDRWIIINRPEFMLWTWLCFTQGNSTGHLHLGFVWSNLRWMTHPENSETSRGASGWRSRRTGWVACYPAHGSEQKLLDLQFHLRQTVTVYHANKQFFFPISGAFLIVLFHQLRPLLAATSVVEAINIHEFMGGSATYALFHLHYTFCCHGI